MWELTRYALEFFQGHLPFTEMAPADELTTAKDDYCLAKTGRVYAIYLPRGGSTQLDLEEHRGPFAVRWFNPRRGGPLQQGLVRTVKGPGSVSIGRPPQDADKDWVALVELALRKL